MHGVDVRGQIAVVTGGAAGLGLSTTKHLLNAGARVFVAARDMDLAQKSFSTGQNGQILALDLSSPESIASFASEIKKRTDQVHLLINNAGIMATPLARNREGFEMQWATIIWATFA